MRPGMRPISPGRPPAVGFPPRVGINPPVIGRQPLIGGRLVPGGLISRPVLPGGRLPVLRPASPGIGVNAQKLLNGTFNSNGAWPGAGKGAAGLRPPVSTGLRSALPGKGGSAFSSDASALPNSGVGRPLLNGKGAGILPVNGISPPLISGKGIAGPSKGKGKDKYGEGEFVKTAEAVQEIADEMKLTELETMAPPVPAEIPEHLAGAIHGSMRMKRFLEADLAESKEALDKKEEGASPNGAEEPPGALSSDEPPTKRQRLVAVDDSSFSDWFTDHDDGILTVEQEEKLEKVKQLLDKWNVPNDYGMRFVVESLLHAKEVDDLLDVEFKPDRYHGMKSLAEQAVMRLNDMRMRKGPPVGSVDAVKTFGGKWDISAEDQKKMKMLSYDELVSVFNNFDGETPIEDLIKAAEQKSAEQAEEEVVAFEKPATLPGLHTMARQMRMELLTEPLDDALVLGDANLSFSSLLAEHRRGLGHTGRVIATTFEDYDTLKLRYEEIRLTIRKLVGNSAEVWHGVDCTRLAADRRFHGLEDSFGSVYYNFPHAGAVRGFFDAHPYIHWRHSNLMSLFFRAVRHFCKPGAILKVTSNCNATGCRANEIISAAECSEFMHIETFPFTEWILRKYHRSFGDKRDERARPTGDSYTSQSAAADMVYCFRFTPTGDELPSVPIKQPPKFCGFMESVAACSCGFMCQWEMKDTPYAKYHFHSNAHHLLDDKAKREVVLQLYKRFLSEASGVHIG